MFENNPLLRSSREKIEYTQEQLLELMKCEEDILYFAENYCYIQTLEDGYILPKLRLYQKKILKAYTDKKNREGRRHCIAMAPRQSAKTVTSAIYFIHYLIFNKDKNIGIVANRGETAIEVVDKIKEIYQLIPLWMQPGIVDGGWNKKGLRLANRMRLLSSAASGSGLRGYTLSRLYLDEFAFLQKSVAEKFMRAMFPTIESDTSGNSMIIITSTPQGLNHFADMYSNAIRQDQKSAYFPIRVYENEVPRALPPEEFKKSIIDEHGLLYWMQEYECKFLGSSALLIDGDSIENIKIKNPKRIIHNDKFFIYEEPKPESFYVLGVDSAEGVKLDSSVIQVLKFTSGKKVKQVAVYRSNEVHPNTFSQIVVEVSKMYNEAFIMIENNAVGVLVCNTIWNTLEYDKIVNTEKRGLGFKTTHKSKVIANMSLKRYMESKWLELSDKTTKHELSVFENGGENIWKATSGNHDDTVMALAIGINFVNTIYYDEDEISKGTIQTTLENSNDMPNLLNFNDGVDYSNTSFGKDDEDEISDLFGLFNSV